MKHDHSGFLAATRPNAAAAAYAAAQKAYASDPQEVLRRFLPMVRRLAWHLNGTGHDSIELEDLIQVGLMALSECVRRHDRPTEDGFAAYAKTRVRGAMIDLIRRESPMSRPAQRRRREISDQQQALQKQLGRKPNEKELAELLGMSASELISAQTSCEPMYFESLDDHYSDQNSAFADQSADSLDLLQDEETRRMLAGAISALPERLQMVTQLYFVEEMNLSEIAKVLEVSIPRIHQLKAQALDTLREALNDSLEIL